MQGIDRCLLVSNNGTQTKKEINYNMQLDLFKRDRIELIERVCVPVNYGDIIYLDEIKSKLVVENAKSLSDKEIRRILQPTVLGYRLIPLAKKYIEEGLLQYDEIEQRIRKRQCNDWASVAATDKL